MDQKPPQPPKDGAEKERVAEVEMGQREIDSASLLQGGKEVLIRHSGELYRLRLTKNDKLILQK